MECSVVFRCDCSNRTYPSNASLKSHQKTKQHIAYMKEKELRELKISLTDRDNTILKLNNTICLLRELNTTILKRLSIESS